MTDVLTAEQRQRCMSRIRCKDTEPEKSVRRMIHRMGYRYRLHVAGLPGKPDLVFTRLRKIVFVHGCFWHMHRCCLGRVKPVTNADFWKKKREGNRQRDAKVHRALRKEGWRVLTIWECEMGNVGKLQRKMRIFLEER